jgi:ribonucleoside-diphosphate reductase alpha chain
MSPVQSLSATILNILTEFGDKKLKKALKPVNPEHGESKEREELMTLLDNEIYSFRPEFEITEKRPISLECDVVKFQNKKEKWVAFVGLLDGYPYEIFTGVLDDEDGIALPKTVTKGHIIKHINEDGTKRYDFTFVNRRGYKTTIEGLSERFNKEYWNYAKLISGVLRYRMPLTNVVKLISSLQLENENINTWANGVARALKKYTNDGEDISEDLNLNADLRNAELDAE